MTDLVVSDLWGPFSRAVAAAAEPGQPAPLYAGLEAALQDAIGHSLFTLLVQDAPRGVTRRLYSSRPTEYPVGGEKPLNVTAWAETVLKKHQPWVGVDADAIRWAFFDHELIIGMGCECCINIPVVYDGRCLGTINILDRAGRYKPEDGPRLLPFASLLIADFRSLQK